MKSDFQKNKLFWALGVVCLANFLAHLAFYPALPATIPIHWGSDGTVNGWGGKGTDLILAATPALMLLLFRALPLADPKGKNYEKHRAVFHGFCIAMVLFSAAVSWLSILAVYGVLPESGPTTGLLVGGGTGAIFIVMGNYMPRIKQNYTFGWRTPWALADEHNWQRTQRMGGIIFIVMGAVFVVTAVFAGALGGNAVFWVDMAAIIGGLAWGYLYSFLVFKGILR